MGAEALDALQAEVASDPKPVRVPLGDTTVRVKPVRKWPSSAMRHLNAGDFDSWAQKALAAEDYKVWAEIDPTIEECEEFFTAWSGLTGQDPGKSQASRRSSKRTARP